MKTTVLYNVHLDERAKMVSFSGWEMPMQYASISEEHRNVRLAVGVFDVCHMGQIQIAGQDSVDFLQYLLPTDVARIRIGSMKYSVMCNETGGVIDDLAIYKKDETDFLLVVNAGRIKTDLQWVQKAARGYSVIVNDLSKSIGMLAVQGPKSECVLTQLLGGEVRKVKYFRFAPFLIDGHEAIVSRSGYTGEDGFEIMCPMSTVGSLWKSLRKLGAAPTGLGARDTLRTEMGYCLYGHELNEEITPIEAGLDRILCLDSNARNFVGREALVGQQEKGSHRVLIGLVMTEKAVPRSGYAVHADANVVGTVTSGTHSPTLGKGIALALVEHRASFREVLHIDLRGQMREAKVIDPPFVQSRVRVKKKI